MPKLVAPKATVLLERHVADFLEAIAAEVEKLRADVDALQAPPAPAAKAAK